MAVNQVALIQDTWMTGLFVFKWFTIGVLEPESSHNGLGL